jgi:hypothetical protein
MPDTKVIICPYCGETQHAGERCRSCGGFFEPLSRQATQNEMGPWYIRDPRRSFQPGCSYETVAKLVERGQVTRYTVIRGPSTRQFWTVARHAPGIAHLLGYCHACDARVDPLAHGCDECGTQFGAYLDRNHLGLSDVRPLPGEAPDLHDHGPETEGSTARWTPSSGVSSFATDDELFGSAARARPVNGHGSPPETNGEPPDAGGGTVEDLVTSPAVRSMQRRLARQQQTIRLLTVLVVLVAIAGALINVMTVTAEKAPAAPPHGDAAPGRNVEQPPEERAAVVEPVATEPVTETIDEAPALDDENLAGVEGGEIAPPPADSPYAADLQRVETLLVQASDDTRAGEERVADYEEALRLLNGVAANAPEDIRPADLAERIAAVEEALERLQVGAFFTPDA